jgi:hypothetical protein
MLDLSTLQPTDDPVCVDIVHPITRIALGPKVYVFGMDSAVYRKVQSDLQAKRFARMTPGKMRLTPAELEEEAMTVLATCTNSWKDVVWDKKPLECNMENAKMLYRALPWLREQVDMAMSDRENFIKASSSS